MSEFSHIDIDFIAVDFHIHTPSSNCYKGSKDDQEYISLLQRYHDKDIKVLAITDHNTVSGYKKILEIKNNLQHRIQFLNEYVIENPDILQLQIDLENSKNQLNIFFELLILPGIEFEANPGIHLLLIFNPNIDLNIIENFLEQSGYKKDIQGLENTKAPNVDVLEVLNWMSDKDGFVIASHADSDKGIYNHTQGTYRAEIFRSRYLTGISYNNPSNREKMNELYKNKEYKRTEPIAFIQSSDYHGGEISDRLTYLKLDQINYISIVKALKNPNECVSPTKDPKIGEILNQIINDPKTFTVRDFSEKQQIERIMCALLNDDYGNLVIGADKKTIYGVKFKSTDLEVLQNINPTPKFENMYIREFPWLDRSVIVFSFKNPSQNIYFLTDNESAFIIRNEEIVKANPKEISEIVEQKIFTRIEQFQSINNTKFISLFEELKYLSLCTSQQVKIISKIEKYTEMISTLIDFELINIEVSTKPKDFTIDLSSFRHGDANGFVYIALNSPPHLEEAYLRCSCPVDSRIDHNNIEIPKFTGEAIVLCSGGGTHFIQNDSEWVIIPYPEPSVPLIRISRKLRLNNKGLIGWLKSSLFLWYCQSVYGSVDLTSIDVFGYFPIPINHSSLGREIAELVEVVLEKEQQYLTNCKDIELSDEKYMENIEEHNMTVNRIAKEIDYTIFKAFNITEEEQKLIFESLKRKEIVQFYNEQL